jgi:hypothetical protein
MSICGGEEMLPTFSEYRDCPGMATSAMMESFEKGRR